MAEISSYVLLLQLASTLSMVGVIWFVQVVHYPLMALVGRESFCRYEMDHQRLTTYVVGPLMLTEAVTAVLLCWQRPTGVSGVAIWLGLGLLVVIWVLTYTVQVPQHVALTQSYNSAVQQRLVAGNWYRTWAWTLRGILLLWMTAQVMTAHPMSSA